MEAEYRSDRLTVTTITISLLLLINGTVAQQQKPDKDTNTMGTTRSERLESHDRRVGLLFTTHRDQPPKHCSWAYWYLQHSKKVWFRIGSSNDLNERKAFFTYRGRPILHVSEKYLLEQAKNIRHNSRSPIFWGDRVGSGWKNGPQGTTLYLELWTRWTWTHPEACGHPEYFGVDFLSIDPQIRH